MVKEYLTEALKAILILDDPVIENFFFKSLKGEYVQDAEYPLQIYFSWKAFILSGLHFHPFLTLQSYQPVRTFKRCHCKKKKKSLRSSWKWIVIRCNVGVSCFLCGTAAEAGHFGQHGAQVGSWSALKAVVTVAIKARASEVENGIGVVVNSPNLSGTVGWNRRRGAEWGWEITTTQRRRKTSKMGWHNNK